MQAPGRVALFATCMVDQIYPHVAETTSQLLRRLGCDVIVPRTQTCCGQVGFNSGYQREARRVAQQTLRAFAEAEAVVVPSGSCAAMIRHFYAELFAGDDEDAFLAGDLGRRTFELSEFLVDVLGVVDVGARWPGRIAYHAACHGLRELHLYSQPLQLLAHVRDAELVELPGAMECCGFGGLFAIKQDMISTAMLERKCVNIDASGADTIVLTDVSCMTQINGGLRRRGSRARVVHLAEVLGSV